MPVVKTFHAKVGVRGNDGQVKVLRVDLPDFAPAEEVLELIGKVLGLNTAGEIVEQLSDNYYNDALDDAALKVCVEPSAGFRGQVVDWHYRV